MGRNQPIARVMTPEEVQQLKDRLAGKKPKLSFKGIPKRKSNVVPLGGRLFRERQMNSFKNRLKNKIQKGK